ncbi:response regulator [candidate division WWE3 bacterium]|nr:response regulator [candidate division WWE3 bacterium]
MTQVLGRVLLVDDEPVLLSMWVRQFGAYAPSVTVDVARSLVEANALLAQYQYDVIGLDGELRGRGSEADTYVFIQSQPVQDHLAAGHLLLAMSSNDSVNDEMKRLGATSKVISKTVAVNTMIMMLATIQP